MAIIRHKKGRRKHTDLSIDKKWLNEFYRLCNGSAWNHAGNEWLNKQFADGKTPDQAIYQCKKIML